MNIPHASRYNGKKPRFVPVPGKKFKEAQVYLDGSGNEVIWVAGKTIRIEPLKRRGTQPYLAIEGATRHGRQLYNSPAGSIGFFDAINSFVETPYRDTDDRNEFGEVVTTHSGEKGVLHPRLGFIPFSSARYEQLVNGMFHPPRR